MKIQIYQPGQKAVSRLFIWLALIIATPFGLICQSNPIFTSAPVTSVNQTQSYLYEVIGNDSDGGELTFSALTLPSWLSLRGPVSYKVSTLAGSGSITYPLLNGTGTDATFSRPIDLTTDANGNIYVVDNNIHVVRKITPDGVVSTFVGEFGVSNIASVDGTGTAARFRNLSGITTGPDNNLYIMDLYKVRKITLDGVVSTIAGDRDRGVTDGTGTDARFYDPTRLALDSNGNIFVGDMTNTGAGGVIRKVTPDGVVTTVAGGNLFGSQEGTGTDAKFGRPFGMVIDSQDNLFFTNLNTYILKMTSVGVVSVFVGNGTNEELDGTGTDAAFRSMRGMGIDASDNLYVVSGDNSSNRVRKVSPGAVVTSPIGSLPGFIDGFGTDTKFSSPEGVTVAADGTIYVADQLNSAIRKVVPLGTVLEGNPAVQVGNHIVSLQVNDDNGGSATQNFTITVIDDIDPVFTSGTEESYAENGTGVAYTAQGSDSETITYSLGEANDESLFSIDGGSGAVSFLSPPDYENPGDGDNNNDYVILIKAHDGTNESGQTVTITVTDVFENTVPVFTSTPITVINDDENYSYSITAADDDGDNLHVTATTIPNWLKVVTTTGNVTSTVAGTGAYDFVDGPGTSAAFRAVPGVAVDGIGNVFVADQDNHRIRKIDVNGVVTTFAGSGIEGFADGPPNTARFDDLKDLAFDGEGNLIVADFENSRIRKVTPEGVVSTIAGSGAFGFLDASGTSAVFNHPAGVAVDANDNIYVADQDNHRIRKIDTNGNVTTFSGSGAEAFADGPANVASFDDLKDIAIDSNGNLVVADLGNNRIRKVTSDGTVSTIAGSGAFGLVNANGTSAAFRSTAGVAVDTQGNIYVADQDNHMIRRIDTDGNVTTFAGSGIEGFADGSASTARFDDIKDLAFDKFGNLYVADFENNRIRKLSGAGFVLTGSVVGQPAGDYPVVLQVSDGNGGTDTQNFVITVTDITAPVFTSAATENFDENGTGVAYAAQASDSETITYSLGEADDESLFSIDGGTGAVSFVSSPDFENPQDEDGNNIYEIAVIATDEGGNLSTIAVSITVNNANDNPPVFVSSPVTEVREGSQYVYKVKISDADGSAQVVGTQIPSWLSLDHDSDIYHVTTLAGSNISSFTDGSGSNATFSSPYGLDEDAAGNIYVADRTHHKIRKITPEGMVSTLAGSGIANFQGGFGTQASFNAPIDLVVDASGNIFVIESENHAVRKITSAGEVTVFAGAEEAGYADGTGTLARFNSPRGIDSDATGNLYVTDSDNRVIRKITPAGEVSTYAGSGGFGTSDGSASDASFEKPEGIAIDQNLNIYVGDANARNIRKINAAGIVSTLAGSGNQATLDGTGTEASFFNVNGMDVDGDGNLYVGEFARSNVRKITPEGLVTTVLGGDSEIESGFSALGLAVSGAGDILLTDGINNLVYKFTQNQVITIAGGSAEDVAYKDGKILWAALNLPDDLAANAAGFIYFTDQANHAVRILSPDGRVSTLAGSGTAGYADGQGTEATFDSPSGIVLDEHGNLYVADSGNNRIRYVTAEGEVSTIAGSGQAAFADGTGTLAAFNSPRGLEIDNTGKLFVSDMSNARIRVISPDKVVSTLAGSGTWGFGDGTGTDTGVAFVQPMGLTIDTDGNLYVADSGNNRVRKISPQGVVTTVAGTGDFASQDGNGTGASVKSPKNVLADDTGNLYIIESTRIRQMTSSGEVTTVVGSGKSASTEGIGTEASFAGLSGIVFSADGDILLTDKGAHQLKKLSLPGIVLSGDPTGQIGQHTVLLTATDGVNPTAEQAFTISVSDSNDPVITSISPADETIDFTGTTITFNFNEDIVKGTGGIGLFNGRDNTAITILGIGSPRVTISDNTATLDLVRALPFDMEFYVKIQAGAFKDTSGNDFAGILDGKTLNLSTPTTPQLTASNPVNNATDFTGSTLSLTFDQDMLAGTGRISVFDAADDSEITGAGVGSGRVTIAGNTVSLDLINPLPLDKDYYVGIPGSALKGTSNNFFPGILDKTTLNFSGATTPALTAANPMDDATDFIGTELTLTFDRNMTVGSGRIQVLDATDDSELAGAGVASPRVTINNNVVTLDLINPLPLNKAVYVNIPGSAFRDASNNFYPGILDKTTLNFSTRSTPQLLSTTPQDEATEFAGTTITFTFDRNVSKGTGRIRVLDATDDSEITGAGVGSARVSINGSVVTLDLIRALPADKQVYVQVPGSAFKDSNDTFYEGILDKTTLNFTAVTTPRLVNSSPADNATGFRGTTITLTFDRNIQADRGRLRLFNATDDTPVTGSGVSGPRVTIVDNVVTFDLINPLPINTDFYLQIPGQAFRDVNNQYYTGMLDKTTLNFSTGVAAGIANLIVLEPLQTAQSIKVLTIYPNPANSQITLDLSSLGGTINLQIVSMDGVQRLRREQVQAAELTVDVSRYVEGVYLIVAQSADGTMVYEKFMIRR